MSISLVRLV